MEQSSDHYFSPEHTWIRLEGDSATVGITPFAQVELGEIVYVELPRVGETFQRDEVFGSLESLKTVSDLFLPLAGEVTAVNERLVDEPTLVNEHPFTEGWLIKIRPANPEQRHKLLTAAAYDRLTTNP
jgi:glycine cleavage system H protein